MDMKEDTIIEEEAEEDRLISKSSGEKTQAPPNGI
jgi:hypothetical protein